MNLVKKCRRECFCSYVKYLDLGSCFLKLGLETRDAAQIETIKEKLTEAGFKLVTERA